MPEDVYRTIEDRTWLDPWHQGLSPAAKCVFHFLIEGAANNAGVAEVSPRQLAFHTGVAEEDLALAIKELDPKVMWWPEHDHFFVVNLHRLQGAKSNLKNFQTSARNQLVGAPAEVLAAVAERYPELVSDAPPSASTSLARTVRSGDRTPTDLISGLVGKLRASHAAWEALTYATVQKALNDYGREVVTYALQSLVESQVVPQKAAHPLFIAACKKVKQDLVSA